MICQDALVPDQQKFHWQSEVEGFREARVESTREGTELSWLERRRTRIGTPKDELGEPHGWGQQ